MPELTVSFLFFDGCPLAPKARENLLNAIGRVGRNARIELEEVDLMDPETPEHLRRWGSPTILIDSKDITGAERGSACHCRMYSGEGGVPSIDKIVSSIHAGFEK